MDFKKLSTRSTDSFYAVLDWLVPRQCIECKAQLLRADHPCCAACYGTLPFQFRCCRHCGQSLGVEMDYCGRCLEATPAFDSCFCPFRYESPIKELIQSFKYDDRPEAARALAQLVSTEIVANNLAMPDLLIPVPLHISRLRARGFNQSLQLCKELAKLLKVPFANNVIEKHKATPAQAKLGLKQRKANLRGSFRARIKPIAKTIAIVDDVFTTGSTADEIAIVLKRNGVKEVHLWAIAHTI